MNITHRSPPQSKLNGIKVRNGAPDLSDQTFLCNIDVTEVQSVINGLHLPHFDEPYTYGFRSSLQNPLPVVFSLIQYLYD